MFVIIPLIVSLTSCVVENPFYRDDKLVEEGIEDKSDSDKLNSPETELEPQIEDNDISESSSDSKEDKGNETEEQENDEETDNPASEQSEDIGDGENQDGTSDLKKIKVAKLKNKKMIRKLIILLQNKVKT